MKNQSSLLKTNKLLVRLFYFGYILFSCMIVIASMYSLFFEKPYHGTAFTWVISFILLGMMMMVPIVLKSDSNIRVWLVYPLCLLLFALLLNLTVIFVMGQNPAPLSDPLGAWNSSFQKGEELGRYFRTNASWFMYSRVLRAMHLISSSIVMPRILNALMHTFTVVVLYYIILICSNNFQMATLISCIYMLWPSHLFYLIVYTPEHLNIFFSILAVLLFLLAYNKLDVSTPSLKPYLKKFLFFVLSALALSLANAFKSIGIVYIIALLILVLVGNINAIKPRGSKGIMAVIKHKFTIGLIVFFISYFLFTQLLFLFMDFSLGVPVNRSTSSYFITTGLNKDSGGTYNVKIGEKYTKYTIENNYDYGTTNKQMWKDFFSNKENLESLDLEFFAKKFMIAWRSIGYLFLTNSHMQPEGENTQILNRDYWNAGVYPIAQVFYVFVAIGLVAGAMYAWKKDERTVIFYSCLVIFGFALLLLLSEVQTRYKCVVYPYMAIVSGYGIYNILMRLKCKFKSLLRLS